MVISVPRHLTVAFAHPPRDLLVSTRPEITATPGKGPDGLTDTPVIPLVEDNGDVHDIVRNVLQTGGFTVLKAADGADALQMADWFPGQLRLLLTAVDMPRMSGPELASRLCASRPTLRVFFMSGYTGGGKGAEDRLPAEAVFLPKPFTPTSLLHAVQGILR